MRSSTRRINKPRKISADSSSDSDSGTGATTTQVKTKPTTTTATKRPASNLSFTADPAGDSQPFPLRKSALARKALGRAAAARGLPLHRKDDDDTDGDGDRGGGTLYSKEYLEELRSETPSTPIPFRGEDVVMGDGDGDGEGEGEGEGVGVADPLGTLSKFGTTAAAAAAAATSIPDPALIKVIKARRAAKATTTTSTTTTSTTTTSTTTTKSKEYISLSLSPTHSSCSDDDNQKKKPTRLVRTEIFDEADEELSSFINDPSTSTSAAHPSRLILTRALSSRAGALHEEKSLRRGQIEEALLGITDDNDDEDDESSSSPSHSDDDHPPDAHDWHRRQLRIATGSALDEKDDPTSSLDARLRYQPPNIPPLPELSSRLKWLQEILGEMIRVRDGLVGRVEEVRREKEEICQREREVQEGLGRVGEEYRRLGLGEPAKEEKVKGSGVEGMGRGLESLGLEGTMR